MNIFQSAVNKLTLWYVSALLAVCLIFSIPAYIITSNKLAGGAQRQAEIIEELDDKEVFLDPFSRRLHSLREQQLRRDRLQLIRTLVIINLGILSLGAYFSYHFAKRTLRPVEEAHEAQAQFATDASHELRTPLAIMQIEIDVALRDKKLNSAVAKKVLASNLEEIARLRNLSEQLLNLTRLDGNQLQKKNLPLSKLAAEEVSHLEKNYQIKIKQSITKDISVSGDEQLLRQLITILVDNAAKYAGDKAADVQVVLKKQDNKALLSVADHGIGIKASELPHIFDRFYRGSDASKHSSSGHGLGLSLAKRIVDTHAGTIHAASQPDGQTVFEITLPLSS